MIPVEPLLPHRRTAIVLDGLKAILEDGCIARATIREGAWYLDDQGLMPAWVGLEMMAQAASAFSGHRNTLSGRPIRVGYLLGTRCFTSTGPAFPVGTDLEIEARVLFLDDSGPSAFRCEIRHGAQCVATAILKAIESP